MENNEDGPETFTTWSPSCYGPDFPREGRPRKGFLQRYLRQRSQCVVIEQEQVVSRTELTVVLLTTKELGLSS